MRPRRKGEGRTAVEGVHSSALIYLNHISLQFYLSMSPPDL